MKGDVGPVLIIWPPALNDVEEIVKYIQHDNPGAAEALKDELFKKMGGLPHHPRLYRRGRLPGTREMVVRRNYIVVYTETPSQVTVLRVLHASMNWP